MYQCNDEFALKTALLLAEENIKSSNSWSSADSVICFTEQIYDFLRGSDDTPEQ